MLYVIVEGKKATKKRSEKSRKFKIFAKGLVRGVGPKWAIFPSLLISGNVGQEKVPPYCRKKKRLFRLEKKRSQSGKFKIYPKSVPGFPSFICFSLINGHSCSQNIS